MFIALTIIFFVLGLPLFAWGLNDTEPGAIILGLLLLFLSGMFFASSPTDEDTTTPVSTQELTDMKDENYRRGFEAGVNAALNGKVRVDTIYVYKPQAAN